MYLRMMLFPYIYTENHATRRTGISLLHPLYYAEGAAGIDLAYAATTSYLFGSTMLVAPIVQPIAPSSQTVEETTWLPPGEWVSFSGAHAWTSPEDTGLNVTDQYALDELPIFVRAGGVLPLRTFASLQRTSSFSDPLVWAVFSGPATVKAGSVAVVEDDGVTSRFESANATATTAMKWVATATGFTATVAPTVGSFAVNSDCGIAEPGYEYAGAGAELQTLADTVVSAAACCEACATFSNCLFWTWLSSAGQCSLKVSRRGRRANKFAVSGVAPRRMPTTRAHGFQFRVGTASTTFSAVTVNGKALAKVAPPSAGTAGTAGWYVQPADTTAHGLAQPPAGTLVILTESIALVDAVTVVITSGHHQL